MKPTTHSSPSRTLAHKQRLRPSCSLFFSEQIRLSGFGRAVIWLVLAIAAATPCAFAQNVTGTVTVGSSPVVAAANPVTSAIYVVNSASGNVSVINAATNTVTATVNTGTDPVAIAVNPVTNTIYVANNGSNNVTVINGADNTTSTVTDPNAIAPVAIAVNSLTNEIYVANATSNNVTVINGNGNTVAGSVGVGSNPDAIAVNPATSMIYVANRSSSNVTVINGGNNSVAATVGVGTTPVSLSIDPATNAIYVANNGSNNVSVISGASNLVVATVNAGSNPAAIAANPVTNTVYVANNGSANVTVINGANNTVTATVNAGTGPVAVATDPTTNQIYVANSGSNNVTAINGATNTTATVTDPNATSPAALAVNPLSNSVYVANSGSANVTVINGDVNTITTTVNTPTNPVAVALNAVTDRIYVANSGNSTVSVIDGSTNQVVATVNTGNNPDAIAINPATNFIYVANRASNTLTVIDGATNLVAATVNTGNTPVAVAVNPVINVVYVANLGGNNVTVIDGATNVVTGTVGVGTAPVAIAVNAATGQVYVANSGSDNVTAFDTVIGSNLTITDPAASRPVALVVEPVTNKIFVVNSYSDNISVIDGASAMIVATINVGDDPLALDLNLATNRAYVANAGNNTVSVIDGNALSVIATVNAGTSPSAVSVDPTSNRIYVANNGNNSTDFGSVTIIDGSTNAGVTTNDPNANKPYALAANPLTDVVYVANNLSSNTTVISAEQVQANPIVVSIAPLPNNTTSNETPTFNFTASNGFGNWPLDELLFQTDTWQGPWTAATPGQSGKFSGTTSTLAPGFHTIYAYATEGEEATSTVTGSQSSPLIGTISSYGFLVATPIAAVTPAALNFGNQLVGTQSASQTVTLGNTGSAPLTFTYAISPSDFFEAQGDTCSTAGGQLAPGTSCTISVVFSPSAAGLENATLTITDNSNGVSGSTQSVALSGTGTTSTYSLNVSVDGSGSGNVTSRPAGINCPSTCQANFPAGTQVLLVATPSQGSTFVGWGGACSGNGSCAVLMNSNQAVSATFALNATTSCTGNTTNWIGGASGNWSNPENWSTGQVPNGGSVNVCINDGNSVPSAVTLDINASVDNLYIDSRSSLTISNNNTLYTNGAIANAGQITVSAAASNTFLTIAGGGSLTGGGTITLAESGGGGNAAIDTANGNQTLTNVDNTIQGVGVVGWNGLLVVNQAGGIINANSSTGALLVNSPSVTNQGLLEATGGNTLNLQNSYNNAGGRILASGSGSTVQFINGTVSGGLLASSGGGTLTTPANVIFTLDGKSQGTLTIAGSYVGANNSQTFLTGTINNTGTIQLNAAASNTFLTVAAAVSLTGGGTVMLTENGSGGNAAISTTNGNQTLTNVNNTIQGIGFIGWNGLSVINQPSGVINANLPASAGSLYLNPPTLTNTGLLEATGGGLLNLQNTFLNAGGNVLANGNGSTVQFISGVLEGGTLNTSNGGLLTIPANNTFTLDGVSTGTLNLAGQFVVANNSTAYLKGTVNNTGSIQLNAGSSNTFLTMAAPVSFTGAGTVTLMENGTGGSSALATTNGNQTLTNVNNLIQGSGVVGWNGLIVVNQGMIDANTPAQGTLTLNPSGLTNEGILEATLGATLQLSGSSTFKNAGGNILASGNASTVEFANGATIQGGMIGATGGGNLGVEANNVLSLDGHTNGPLTINGTYTGANNSTTDLSGTINNTGNIQLNAAANNTFLTMASAVSFIGNGTVTLASTAGGGTAALATTNGDQLLINVDNTIQGTGVVGWNGLGVTNQGTINANVSGGTLTVNSPGFTNQGLLQASAGGILALNGSTINNQKGTIQVNGATSTVQFVNNVHIEGGTVGSVNNGVLTVPSGNNITLDGSTLGPLTIAGTYAASNNTSTYLSGTINNTGTIQVNAGANNTFLTMSASVTLTGAGTVSLSSTLGQGDAALATTNGDQTLTNANNRIQGTGFVGWNGLNVVNQANGVINANAPSATGALTLNPPNLTNQGLLEATNSGTLNLQNTFYNSGGQILATGSGSTVQLVSGTVQGGTLTGASGGILTVPANDGFSLDGSTAQGSLTLAGQYVGANNTNTYLSGTIVNTGNIQLNAGVNNTFLTMAAAVTLTGNGTVTLSSTPGAGTAALATTNGNQSLTNVNNFLQGTGVIGWNGLEVTNQGTINANIAAGTLTLNPSVFTNQGLIEATAGGILALSGSTINNASGTIKVSGASSVVQFVNNARIESGTLSTASNGTFTIPSGNTITLDGSTLGPLALAGTYAGANNTQTYLTGSINNSGNIQLNAAANNTFLTMAAAVSLTGNGTVTLSQSGTGSAALATTNGQQTLTNVSNVLQGAGVIGWNGLNVVNQGTINANSGTLTLNPPALTNQGLLEATVGGALALSNGTINNGGGTIQVNGATSTVQFVNNATIQGGTLTTANNGIFTIPSGNAITLDGNTHGTLNITGTYVGANNTTTYLVGAINNTGTIQVNAAANNTFLTVAAPVSLAGNGIIALSSTATGGSAALATTNGNQTLTNVGNTLQGSGVIGWNGLALANQGTVNASASGGLLLNPSSLSNQGVLEATGSSTLSVATSVANAGGTILANGSGAAVQFSNGLSVQGGTLNNLSGGFVGSASGNTLTLDGTANALSIAAGATYVVANNSTTNIQGTINNNGTILLNSAGSTTVLSAPGNGATLMGAGLVTMTSGPNVISGLNLTNNGNTIADLDSFTVNAYAQNAGLFQVAATGSASSSVIDVNGGVAQIDGTLSAATGVSSASTGTLSGNGLIAANVSAAGITQPGDIPNPGILTVGINGVGSYTQSSAGAFNVLIGGLKSGAQYSQLNVPAPANIGGTLNVTLIDNFVPQAGNQFAILNASTLTGQFTTTNLPSLPPTLSWMVNYNPTSVVLSVVQQNNNYTLTVTTLGTGSGTVTDNLQQIDCTDTNGVQSGMCQGTYQAGTVVTLTETPVPPSTFGGWGGACSGTGGCMVTMNSNQAVTAAFVPPPVDIPVQFACPGGVYPCQNVTSPPAIFNCPSGGNPCMDPNAHSLTLNTVQLNAPFTLTVSATEVPTTQANGDCENGHTPQDDFDCRFTSFFAYQKLGDGDIIVPLCNPYSAGNCVFYSVFFQNRGQEPPTSDYDGPITWAITYNNNSFAPPPPYQQNNQRLFDDPDYEVSPNTPYGTNCDTPMLINGVPTNPPIYCQFVFDITTYYQPSDPPDAAIGGKTKQFNDVVVAYPITVAGAALSISKVADQSQVPPGNPIGYTITVSNSSAAGTGAATNAAINDPLPAGANVNWTISPPYNGPGSCTINGAPPTQTLSCTIGSISPAISVAVHVTSASSSVGTYVNTATVTAANSATQSSTATIQVVNATGPIATLTPSKVNFGNIHYKTFGLRNVILGNTGDANLDVSSIKITPPGNDLDDFTVVTHCPKVLAPGKNCKISITFYADADNYSPTATLSVTDNAPGSPQTVPLRAAVINPKAKLRPTLLNFANQKAGTTSPPKTVTLTNAGTTTLKLFDLTIDGNFAFASGTTCSKGTDLQPGSSCVMNVTFTPNGRGDRRGRIILQDNDVTRRQKVQLEGVGD